MDGFVENTKGIVSIVRDGLITLILILLLVVPATVNQSLIKAGFVEGDIGGFKWKAAVEDNNKQLTDAADTIGSLQQQLTTTQTALKESEDARKTLATQVTQTMPDSPAAETARATPTPLTNQIVLQNNQVLKNAVIGGTNLRARIQANQNLLESAPSGSK
jgi:hypothetical protein